LRSTTIWSYVCVYIHHHWMIGLYWWRRIEHGFSHLCREEQLLIVLSLEDGRLASWDPPILGLNIEELWNMLLIVIWTVTLLNFPEVVLREEHLSI
jgi:hypothetical protein